MTATPGRSKRLLELAIRPQMTQPITAQLGLYTLISPLNSICKPETRATGQMISYRTISNAGLYLLFVDQGDNCARRSTQQ
jgi:hypothetical protein